MVSLRPEGSESFELSPPDRFAEPYALKGFSRTNKDLNRRVSGKRSCSYRWESGESQTNTSESLVLGLERPLEVANIVLDSFKVCMKKINSHYLD